MLVKLETGHDEWGPFWFARIASGYRAGALLCQYSIPLRFRSHAEAIDWLTGTGYEIAP